MNIQVTDPKQYFLSSSGNKAELLNGSYKSHVRFELPKLISREKNVLYHTVKLVHAELPYSFYIINEYNNNIYFQYNGTTYLREIEEGNYDAITLLETLTNLFNPLVVTIELDEISGKIIFSSYSPFTILGTSTLYNILGLTADNYTAVFDNSVYKIKSPYQLNLLGTKNIFVKCNLVLENYNTHNNDYNTLRSIPVLVPPYGLITYSNNETESLAKNHQVDMLELTLTDDRNNEINFGNADWCITIEVKTYLTISVYNNNSFNEFLETR